MKCDHNNPIFTPTPQGPHHGKETCGTCNLFIRWVPKPATLARQQQNSAALVKLRGEDRMTAWERSFVATLDGQGPKISPKQQDTLTKLCAKYGI